MGNAFDIHHIGESLVADEPLISVHMELFHLLFPVFAFGIQRNADKYNVPTVQILFQFLEVGDFRHTGSAPRCPKINVDIFAGKFSETMLLTVLIFKYSVGQGSTGRGITFVAKFPDKLFLIGSVTAKFVEACQMLPGLRMPADVVFDDSPGDVFPDGRNAEPLLQETDLVFGFRGVLLQVFADIEVTAV